jgi:hypothetical protein
MVDPQPNPGLDAPAASDVAQDKPSAWDAIIDTVIDDASGEISFVVADAETDKATANPAVQAPDEATSAPDGPSAPPLDKSYQEIRAWATRVSQENAEIKRKLSDVEQRYEVADSSKDFDDFVGRFAAALPEDMHGLVSDRAAFARVVAKAADVLADRKTKTLKENVGSLQAGVADIGRALEFVAAAAPEVGALVPYVQALASNYGQANNGASIFDAYSTTDVLAAARAYRAQTQQQPQTQVATTAPGQGFPAPPSAAQPSPVARPVGPAQRAASAHGVSMNGDQASSIGRSLETGSRAFAGNIRSIIDDVIGDALANG